ncbi:MAG: peptidylprolyl isomerase, partial [Acidobacteriota bacterium]|nr:peptidylprolyl isomerase [Acidobacteriota bacterium]
MFDLFRRRDKAVRIMLGGLLGIVALSMLIYLIPGAGMPASGADEQVIAEIGKDAVTTREIDRIVQERIRGRQLPPEMIHFVIPQLIDQAISERAVAYQAKRMGFEVSDAALANTLRSFPNLAELPPDQYRANVEQMGFPSVAAFENNVRTQLYLTDLQTLASEGLLVTPKEVQSEFDRRNEKIKLEYITFDATKLKSEVKVNPVEMQAFFKSSSAQFPVPEARSFQLIVADQQKVAESIQVSDAQMQQYYNSHRDQFRTPERVKARHILLTTTGKSPEETAKIKTKAEGLLKQIRGGADFAELAKQNSDDPGSKANGGDLGWVVRGQTVKNFETAAFSLKPKEISNLVTTEYGFHIIQVLEKQDAHVQGFDEVRVQIADELKKGTLNDRVQSLAEQARTELAKAPAAAEQIAAKLGLQYVKVEKHKAGEPMPLIGGDKQVDEGVTALKKGEVSQVMQAGNRLVVAVLNDVTPARQAELAEVEPAVRERFVQYLGSKLAQEKAQKAAEMLRSNGGDLNAVAKSLGASVKTSDFFTRAGAIEGVGSASYFADAFAKPVGSVVGPVGTGTQNVVAKVADKQKPDAAKMLA